MGFFDFLKGKNDKPENHNADIQTQTDIDRFEKELLAVIPRYISQPGAKVEINARHQVTNKIIPFAEGFPEQFNPWRIVKSTADRRGIIYSLLDTQFGNQLKLWQAIERFNDDRYAEKALQIAVDRKDNNDEQDSNYWNALAKTNFILTRYEEAEQNCLKATAIDKSNIRTKRIFADILHCTNRQDKAHNLYNEILSERLPKDKNVSLSVEDLLGFDGDITNSPIYAIGWLQGDKSVTNETWEWANEEFYYSPHFRSQYAFHLIEQGELMKGFVKLLNLSKEMSWFRDGVVNSYKLIDTLELADKMQEDKVRLKAIIETNNWTDQDPNLHRVVL